MFLLFLTGPETIEKLEYRFKRNKKDVGAIEDVYDGELYKKHSCPGGFLSEPHNISFLGNTDGVALIRSNGYGVWPVYLTINEIPPTERCVFCTYLFQTTATLILWDVWLVPDQMRTLP